MPNEFDRLKKIEEYIGDLHVETRLGIYKSLLEDPTFDDDSRRYLVKRIEEMKSSIL